LGEGEFCRYNGFGGTVEKRIEFNISLVAWVQKPLSLSNYCKRVCKLKWDLNQGTFMYLGHLLYVPLKFYPQT
jgi:hypothetical protein